MSDKENKMDSKNLSSSGELGLLPNQSFIEKQPPIFDEANSNFTQVSAMLEANRCLYCYDAPCIKGCPVGVNIPEFIARIRSRNFTGAAKIIYSAMPFGATCGQVCPVEALCEKACSSKFLSLPIEIGRLQRFVCEIALKHGYSFYSYPKVLKKNRVAVIGGGPSGISCAWSLRLKGYPVTLFEQESSLGGLLVAGIPPFRLSSQIVRQEIANATQELEIVHQKVDTSLALTILKEYDAIFLGCGLTNPLRLQIPGAESNKVLPALYFLKDFAQGKFQNYNYHDKDVAIVGGGATAIDAARAALRLGAQKVVILYRRTAHELPAFPSEFHLAVTEGVQFLWLVTPIAIQQHGEKIRLILQHMKLGAVGQDGRRTSIPIQPSVTTNLEVDFLLEALSAAPETGICDIWDLGYSSSGFLKSKNPKVFLGGDLVGAGTVVKAIADGLEAAKLIENWLK